MGKKIEKETKNSISFKPVLYLLFLGASITLMITGFTLIILKMFGFPLLFEGVMFSFTGLICVFLIHLQETFLQVLDYFSESLELAQKYNKKNHSYTTPNYKKRYYNPNVDAKAIEISALTSPEEIKKMKEEFPELSKVIDSIINTMNFDTNTDDLMQNKDNQPLNLANLQLEELKKRLQQAIDNEEFEQASLLKAEIDNRG